MTSGKSGSAREEVLGGNRLPCPPNGSQVELQPFCASLLFLLWAEPSIPPAQCFRERKAVLGEFGQTLGFSGSMSSAWATGLP